ncbi:MAG: non-heme iron oxygenase ferredoxin subunit [Anaerolineales bacterium]
MYDYTKINPKECEFLPVASVDEIVEGDRLYIEVDELAIVLFNVAGRLFAIADLCSHDDGPLGDGELDGDKIICPRHGARFDISSGKALSLPAIVDIPAYPTRVVDNRVEVGFPIGD